MGEGEYVRRFAAAYASAGGYRPDNKVVVSIAQAAWRSITCDPEGDAAERFGEHNEERTEIEIAFDRLQRAIREDAIRNASVVL